MALFPLIGSVLGSGFLNLLNSINLSSGLNFQLRTMENSTTIQFNLGWIYTEIWRDTVIIDSIKYCIFGYRKFSPISWEIFSHQSHQPKLWQNYCQWESRYLVAWNFDYKRDNTWNPLKITMILKGKKGDWILQFCRSWYEWRL